MRDVLAVGSSSRWGFQVKLRYVDTALVLVAVVGGVLTWQAARQRSGLERESARLSRSLGDLPTGDASRVRIAVVETGDPMHFLWRLAVPKGTSQSIKVLHGDQNSAGVGIYEDGLFRVRFRENGQGNLELYTQTSSGASLQGDFGDGLGRFLRGRWGELRVERLGRGQPSVLEPERQVVLLRLVMPDRMWEQVRRELPSWSNGHTVPVILEVKLGPDPPQPGG